MRMDREQPIRLRTCNQLPEEELSASYLLTAGDLPGRSPGLSQKRQEGLISTTAELAAIIKGHTGPLPARQAPCAGPFRP